MHSLRESVMPCICTATSYRLTTASAAPTTSSQPMMAVHPDYMYKIILLGDSNVGKTSFFTRVKSGMFFEDPSFRLRTVDSLLYEMEVDGTRVTVSYYVCHPA